MQIVKEMMAVQERAYKNGIEIFYSEVKNDIRNLYDDIQEMKCSLQFSQKDIDELKLKVFSTETKVNSQHIALEHIDSECEGISRQVDYLENQPRRNNIKILGLAESKEERTLKDIEGLIKSTIKDTYRVEEKIEIERAHRIGKPRKPNAVGKDGRPLGPRAVVAKLYHWKQKERILKAARNKKPKGLLFVQDFSQRILDKRAEQKDELIKARKDGKIAYFVMDRLITRDPPDKNKSFISNDNEISFTEP